jgi:4-hydroxy-3-methylbut-2-enyl diphosphate reductase
MKVLLGSPRGFCAGVVRAVEIVELALERLGKPVFVRHEIVHNPFVVDSLRQRGAVFIEDLSEVPDNQVVIFSAHGVSPRVRMEAQARGLRVIDATCPLVTKVHIEALKYSQEGYSIILVGHRDHPETVGTAGEVPGNIVIVETAQEAETVEVINQKKVAVLTQTTLSVDDTKEIIDALRSRFPNLLVRNDICYATANRQLAAKTLAKQVDLVLVIGAPNSSNCNRLKEVVQAAGVKAFLVNGPDEVTEDRVRGAARIGIVSGASTPEVLVNAVTKKLAPDQIVPIEVVQENVRFSLPSELR